MKLYAGNVGKISILKEMKDLNVGTLFTFPGYKAPNSDYYALDNGAYSAYINDRRANFKAYPAFIERYPNPDFVVVPDKVAQGSRSLSFSLKWLPELPRGRPYYLAVQDGMKEKAVAQVLNKFAGLFVGGTMDWKLRTSEDWVALAHSQGLKCHIGRVGTWWNIVWAKRIGADSIDSTTWPRNRDFHHVRYAKAQSILTDTFQRLDLMDSCKEEI